MEYLRQITEDNFMEAFNLKLANGQERFVSHPIRSLAQAYVYRNQCQPFGIYKDDTMIGYVMVIYDYDIPEYDIWHMRKTADLCNYMDRGILRSAIAVFGRTEDCLPCWMQCLLKLQAVYLCCCVWCFVVLRQ